MTLLAFLEDGDNVDVVPYEVKDGFYEIYDSHGQYRAVHANPRIPARIVRDASSLIDAHEGEEQGIAPISIAVLGVLASIAAGVLMGAQGLLFGTISSFLVAILCGSGAAWLYLNQRSRTRINNVVSQGQVHWRHFRTDGVGTIELPLKPAMDYISNFVGRTSSRTVQLEGGRYRSINVAEVSTEMTMEGLDPESAVKFALSFAKVHEVGEAGRMTRKEVLDHVTRMKEDIGLVFVGMAAGAYPALLIGAQPFVSKALTDPNSQAGLWVPFGMMVLAAVGFWMWRRKA